MRDRHGPRISVVVPCFNQGAYLDDALHSCVEAYSGPLEIVVVDDGSTDPDTGRYLEAIAKLPGAEIIIVRQPNGGLSRARNAGLRRVTGDYVQFLDADDLLVSGKLDQQLVHFQLNPSTDVSVCDYFLSDETRLKVTPGDPSIGPFALELDDFLFRWERGFSIPIHAALFRRASLSNLWFVETQRAKEDWLFWVSLKMRGARLSFLPLRLCVYRQHRASMTKSRLPLGLEWLKAAAEIERWTCGSHPDFMDRAVRWYLEFYASGDRPGTERPAEADDRGAASGPLVVMPAHKSLAAPADPDPELTDAARSISVVVPAFNHANYLRACILSAHEQTLAPREIVCVDDGSTDPGIRPLLEELAAEVPELRLHLLPENRGISAAQNLAVELATGEFVAFLDCDDFLAPTAIESVARQITQHPRADYIFSDRFDVDAENRVLRYASYGGYRPDQLPDRTSHRENLLDGMIASHLKVIRRARIIEAGGFEPKASGVQDWDLALKIAELGELVHVAEPLYYHRIHRNSVTLGQSVMMFRLTNEVRRRHQLIREHRPELPNGTAPAAGAVRDLLLGRRPQRFQWNPSRGAWRDDTGVAIVQEPRAPRDAFRLWAGSRHVVFAVGKNAPVATLAFLREFNSYFDAVVCADGAEWAALHRYMWHPRALGILEGELPLEERWSITCRPVRSFAQGTAGERVS
jgi:glycosyltransferase involved in cell wall biosynthesis